MIIANYTQKKIPNAEQSLKKEKSAEIDNITGEHSKTNFRHMYLYFIHSNKQDMERRTNTKRDDKVRFIVKIS